MKLHYRGVAYTPGVTSQLGICHNVWRESPEQDCLSQLLDLYPRRVSLSHLPVYPHMKSYFGSTCLKRFLHSIGHHLLVCVLAQPPTYASHFSVLLSHHGSCRVELMDKLRISPPQTHKLPIIQVPKLCPIFLISPDNFKWGSTQTPGNSQDASLLKCLMMGWLSWPMKLTPQGVVASVLAIHSPVTLPLC